MPPLYKITHGKKDIYAYDDAGRDEEVAKIRSDKPDANIVIQRYKGLGEMDAEQLWDTTMNPENRILKKVVLDDPDAVDKTFSVLMGEDVAPRKKFIQTHAKLANLDI